MKKKLNAKFMLIAAIAIVATAACAIVLFYSILVEQIFDDLKANAHVVSLVGLSDMPKNVKEQFADDGLRITLVNEAGEVLYDSEENEEKMENHRGRPEIERALMTGEGRGMRKSVTSAKHTFYYAMKLSDGTVLRVGKASSSIYNLGFRMAVLIVVVGITVFVICVIFAKRLTLRIVEPIEKMASNIVLVDETEVYEEMRPFISTIKQQHMDILNHAQMRQEFTANVSHELKTPLTAISGYAELIASGMTNEKDTKHFADEIHHSAERLQSLINDIIKLSELDDEDLKLEFEPIDLYEMGRNCISQMELQAQKNEVTLCLEGKPISINGNRTLIEELLYNLCSNAVRYNKRGGTVTIVVAEEDGRSTIAVKDTGIGIPKDQQDRVFERFYRVDKSRSKSTGGTGLGLAIVKHIVAQHDAQIELTSEEGVGTEIKVVF
ncbi:MAG: ATP-binding protein [Clostridiales bacterium]|nr:ATP-binding protein [Roseburia sp.]MDD7636627.1 ATP-binding protein [Clostridiales bacterium]MDY4113737.1 ATP-binding protein [Roseburia sp.]